MKNKKSLGQHWLKDRAVLTQIAKYATLDGATDEDLPNSISGLSPPAKTASGESDKLSLPRRSQTVTTVATENRASPRNDGSDPHSVRERDNFQIPLGDFSKSSTLRHPQSLRGPSEDPRKGGRAERSQSDVLEKSPENLPTILEIGPGLGTLTSVLLKLYKKVIAIEFDENLAQNLPKSFPGKDLTVINADILDFDLDTLPKNYTAIGNIPYYITSPILRKFLTAKNKPQKAIFLVQKEVADRAIATTGKHTVLSLTTQAYAKASAGIEVKKSLFIPPPKVDSKVLILEPYKTPKLSAKTLDFIKLAFSSPRKKLAHNIATSLHISREKTLEILKSLNIDENARPADIPLEAWQNLSEKAHTLTRSS